MEIDETDNGKDLRVDNGGRFGGYVNDTAGKQPAFSMPTDNKGKELSEKQKEYFKYSKIRDDKGRLIEVYHRTNQDFTQFDKNKIGAWEKYKFHKMFVGSDWKGTDAWNLFEKQFNVLGVEIIYLNHTDGISSSMLRKKMESLNF